MSTIKSGHCQPWLPMRKRGTATSQNSQRRKPSEKPRECSRQLSEPAVTDRVTRFLIALHQSAGLERGDDLVSLGLDIIQASFRTG